MSDTPERDDHTGTETTGHVWDGIKELNTPLPKWWLYTLWATIIWGVAYMVVYPSTPYFKDGEMTYTKGTMEYSSRDDVAAEVKAAKESQSAYLTRIEAASYDEIRQDADLMNFAAQGGKAAFGDNCAPCHGSGAQGFVGFPNLNDDDWLWGGTLDDIDYTIKHGIRWDENLDTRLSDMPRFLDDEILDRDQILQVTEYVLGMSGADHDVAKAAGGAEIYANECAVCHADDGSGDRFQGAPNLKDAIWLFGSDRQSVYDTIAHARRGVMPAWVGRLDAATIKQLALYVHGLGGGEATPAADESR